MTAVPPITRTAERLGDTARPARGRAPVARFSFAVCYLEQVAEVEPYLAGQLAGSTGPARCAPVLVEAYRGAGIGPALDALGDLGQSADQLLRLAEAVHALAAARPDTDDVRLVIARTHALWNQPARLVGLS